MSLIGLREQLQNHLSYWLNDVLLDAGMYENIEVDEEDFKSSVLSTLYPVDDDQYSSSDTTKARVWRSPYTNWVYESGITPPSGMDDPIVASGVYVGGVFKTRTNLTYGHFIDYQNGRIVFNTEQDESLDVRAEFSYKFARIKLPNRRDEIFIGRHFFLNPDIDPTILVPSGAVQELPLVLMEIGDSSDSGLQLGGGKIMHFEIHLHVVANNDSDRDRIMSVLESINREVPIMVDWNITNHPLNFNGDFLSGENPFSFKAKQADNTLFFHKLYFNKFKAKIIPNTFGFSRGRVTFEVDIRNVF